MAKNIGKFIRKRLKSLQLKIWKKRQQSKSTMARRSEITTINEEYNSNNLEVFFYKSPLNRINQIENMTLYDF